MTFLLGSKVWWSLMISKILKITHMWFQWQVSFYRLNYRTGYNSSVIHALGPLGVLSSTVIDLSIHLIAYLTLTFLSYLHFSSNLLGNIHWNMCTPFPEEKRAHLNKHCPCYHQNEKVFYLLRLPINPHSFKWGHSYTNALPMDIVITPRLVRL